MTPEQRAREITDRHMKPLPGTRLQIVMADPMTIFADIAETIRTAERDTVEQIAEAFSVGTSVTHRPIHPQDVADRIRHMNRDR
jgi:hypothetical protein